MSDKPMTDEEYLKMCGWVEPEYDDGLWSHPRRMVWFNRAEAVKAQLDEDRARHNFVRERSTMSGGLMVPAPKRLAETKPSAPLTASPTSDAPPDSGPANDLATVATRINKRLNDMWFEDTSRALALGIQKPGVYEEEGFAFVTYDAFCGVTFVLSERVARAYDRWLAAGNVGKHFEGEVLRPEIDALTEGRR